MTRTFLLELNVPDNDMSSLEGIAEDITESLTYDGYEVVSCRPWDSTSPDNLGQGPADPDQLTLDL